MLRGFLEMFRCQGMLGRLMRHYLGKSTYFHSHFLNEVFYHFVAHQRLLFVCHFDIALYVCACAN